MSLETQEIHDEELDWQPRETSPALPPYEHRHAGPPLIHDVNVPDLPPTRIKTTSETERLEQELERMRQELALAQRKANQRVNTILHEALKAGSNGKFIYNETPEVPNQDGLLLEIDVRDGESYGNLRNEIKRVCQHAGMDEDRIDDFVLAVGEATSNALKHAQGGTCRLYRQSDTFIFELQDSGGGIPEDILPSMVLGRGTSTKVSLGMGFPLMTELADKVTFTNSSVGTHLTLEMAITPQPVAKQDTDLEALLSRF